MKLLIYILILLNIIFPIYSIIKSSYKKGFEVNFITAFFIGFIFYLIIPIIVGMGKIFYSNSLLQHWFQIFNTIEEKEILIYLINVFAFSLAFYLGSVIATKNKIIKVNKKINIDFDVRYLNIFYILDLLALIYFTYLFRNSFFKGYLSQLNLTLTKGTFVAVSLMMLSLSIVYSVKKKEMNPELSFLKTINNKYVITYFIASLLILSLGGRLYFLSSIVIYIVFYTKYFKKIPLKVCVVIGVCGVLFVGLLGVLRQSSSHFNFGDIILNILLESLFTSFSLIAYIASGINPLLKMPIYLGSDFINLIPSAIFPNKIDYIVSPSGIYNPHGALSSYVSFMSNFGVVGTIIFMFILGYVMKRMKDNNDSILLKCFYIGICGWLPFTFFRDGFSVSIVKNIFEFSILIPFIVIIFANFMTTKKWKNIYRTINKWVKEKLYNKSVD